MAEKQHLGFRELVVNHHDFREKLQHREGYLGLDLGNSEGGNLFLLDDRHDRGNVLPTGEETDCGFDKLHLCVVHSAIGHHHASNGFGEPEFYFIAEKGDVWDLLHRAVLCVSCQNPKFKPKP